MYLEINNPSDSTFLQHSHSLHIILSWANEWELPVSVSTCNILSIGSCLDDTMYYVNGCRLPRETVRRDLGVLIIHAEHVVHRRGYCFHFGCMYVCMYVSALERKRLIGMT